MAYYKRLRDLREDRDLTQKDLAEELYMQTTQYRRYETGERSLSLETAVALAEFYNVSLDYLAELTDYNGKIETSELSVDEKQLLTYFRKLNSTDKERLLERAMTLCEK
ncbi:MAG: helix-turn-helix transcriptional regulator [Clostridia bacterium]|nr:helix-turn-helix transcriptional regulator [Clostridia bacterium]